MRRNKGVYSTESWPDLPEQRFPYEPSEDVNSRERKGYDPPVGWLEQLQRKGIDRHARMKSHSYEAEAMTRVQHARTDAGEVLALHHIALKLREQLDLVQKRNLDRIAAYTQVQDTAWQLACLASLGLESRLQMLQRMNVSDSTKQRLTHISEEMFDHVEEYLRKTLKT